MSDANWKPTHTIPESGLPARSEANAALEPLLRIRSGVEVAVVESLGGWTKIRTDTGWEAWVDGTRLTAMAPPPAAAAAPPPPPAADP
ncbi:MAG: SH3 domain-containing protein, partial [Acidimicrobiia bacterium]|nr:SH3 domain-containing protein [Acidimicrobiia bacterium]